jgi:hypothetical protein
MSIHRIARRIANVGINSISVEERISALNKFIKQIENECKDFMGPGELRIVVESAKSDIGSAIKQLSPSTKSADEMSELEKIMAEMDWVSGYAATINQILRVATDSDRSEELIECYKKCLKHYNDLRTKLGEPLLEEMTLDEARRGIEESWKGMGESLRKMDDKINKYQPTIQNHSRNIDDDEEREAILAGLKWADDNSLLYLKDLKDTGNKGMNALADTLCIAGYGLRDPVSQVLEHFQQKKIINKGVKGGSSSDEDMMDRYFGEGVTKGRYLN